MDHNPSAHKNKNKNFRCSYDFGLRRDVCARDDRAMRFHTNWTVAEGVSIAGGPRSGHSLIMVGEDFFGGGGCAGMEAAAPP